MEQDETGALYELGDPFFSPDTVMSYNYRWWNMRGRSWRQALEVVH